MANFINEHRFSTAQELLNALTPWSEGVSLDGYIFRGHSNSNYALAPASIREGAKDSIWSYSLSNVDITGSTKDNEFSQAYVEYQLVRDFYREADAKGLHVPSSVRLRDKLHQKVDFHTMSTWLESDIWLPEDMLEVAALAQHYGIPTRLLDWTYDPFVAAYFASKPSSTYDGELCIWGLNTGIINAVQTVGKHFPLRLVTPHYSGNPNLAAQSGLFTHWAHRVVGLNTIKNSEIKALPLLDRRPLDVLIRDYLSGLGEGGIENIFLKLTLPSSESSELARLLRKIGYGPAKLFPGYEGVAQELKERPLLRKSKST